MTKQECAIVMAYTGVCMLTGEDFGIFHKYVEDIMGRPIYTHEMCGAIANEIKQKSEIDFINLCRNAESEGKRMSECDYCRHVEMCSWRESLEERGCDFFDYGNKWIPVSERLPKESEYVGNVCKYYLIQDEYGDMHVAHYNKIGWIPIHSLKALGDEVMAWMPLPQPYKAESEEA